jgi:hypothetical protein
MTTPSRPEVCPGGVPRPLVPRGPPGSVKWCSMACSRCRSACSRNGPRTTRSAATRRSSRSASRAWASRWVNAALESRTELAKLPPNMRRPGAVPARARAAIHGRSMSDGKRVLQRVARADRFVQGRLLVDLRAAGGAGGRSTASKVRISDDVRNRDKPFVRDRERRNWCPGRCWWSTSTRPRRHLAAMNPHDHPRCCRGRPPPRAPARSRLRRRPSYELPAVPTPRRSLARGWLVAGAGRAGGLGAVLDPAGAGAHAGRERLAAGRGLLPRRAGGARGPVGAGLVRRHRRAAVEPEPARARASACERLPLWLCGAGGLMALAAFVDPGEAVMANYIPMLDSAGVPRRASLFGLGTLVLVVQGLWRPVPSACSSTAPGACASACMPASWRPRWRCWHSLVAGGGADRALGQGLLRDPLLGRRPRAAVHLDAADAGGWLVLASASAPACR